MTTKDTIIFDLDGTLIHSAPDIHAAMNFALLEMGRTPLSLPVVISFIGHGVEALVEQSLKATGGFDQPTLARAVASVTAYYAAHTTTLTRVYPGVTETLEALKRAGARMGVCTNKLADPAQDICARLDLDRFFDVIVGAEDGHPRKPDPAPLLRTISKLGGRPGATIYIGDSAVDYHTARNAEVSFRLFSGGYLNEALPDLAMADRFDQWSLAGIRGT